jgi:uncharacterized protein with HEPN domain
LRDIIEAIERIERYAVLGRERFDRDEFVQNWCVHHLQVIGEAAARLGRAYHEDNPGVPWSQIVAMRNILVHDYFGIDTDEVWNTVHNDLPVLRTWSNQTSLPTRCGNSSLHDLHRAGPLLTGSTQLKSNQR